MAKFLDNTGLGRVWDRIKTYVATTIGGKADKVSSPTTGNFAGLDANGNITDSGSKASDFATSSDVSGKMDADGSNADSTVTFESKVQEGTGTTASGNYSHAEGSGTCASSNYSHAEGYGTRAVGFSSHAEGNGTTAGGYSSHAEGTNTCANNQYSHVEGFGTRANGDRSHAEGSNTTTGGNYSHAEGASTCAGGHYSHAEGSSTCANDLCSHAEGDYSIANGGSSHAEGHNTLAGGYSSHAEGSSTCARGDYSHAEGSSTCAGGTYSHSGGSSCTAVGNHSFVHGNALKAENAHQVLFGTSINSSYNPKYSTFTKDTTDTSSTIKNKFAVLTDRSGVTSFNSSNEFGDPDRNDSYFTRGSLLDLDDLGNLYLHSAVYKARGSIRNTLVANGRQIILESGAMYALYCVGWTTSSGAFRGVNAYVIGCGIGTSTTALAAPRVASIGAAGSACCRLSATYGNSSAPYVPVIGIGCCTTAITIRYTLVKVSGSTNDFPTA